MNNERWPSSAGGPPGTGIHHSPLTRVPRRFIDTTQGLGDLHWTAILGTQWCASDDTSIPLTPWSKRKEGESFGFIFWGSYLSDTMEHVTFLFSVIVSTGVLTHAGDIKVAVLPDWWQYIPRFVSGQKVSSLQFTNLTSESNETLYDEIIEVISYLNESHSDVVFGPCRRDISIAVEELRMPYICTTFDPEAEGFKFKILPALSDFIEAMGGLVYGQYRRGGNEEWNPLFPS